MIDHGTTMGCMDKLRFLKILGKIASSLLNIDDKHSLYALTVGDIADTVQVLTPIVIIQVLLGGPYYLQGRHFKM